MMRSALHCAVALGAIALAAACQPQTAPADSAQPPGAAPQTAEADEGGAPTALCPR